MGFIKQNAPGLNPDIQAIGCFFRAALHLAEMQAQAEGKSKYELQDDQINRLWARCKSLKYIGDKTDSNGNVIDTNCMISSAACANLAIMELGCVGRFSEVATFNEGTMYWYRGQRRRADYFIQKIKQNGPNKYHFINVDKNGQLEWDPHEPNINNQGTVYTVCYRYDA